MVSYGQFKNIGVQQELQLSCEGFRCKQAPVVPISLFEFTRICLLCICLRIGIFWKFEFITKMVIVNTCTDKVTKARNTSKAMQFKIMLIITNSDNYLLWQLPGIACLNEDNGSLGWSGFGNGCNGFGRGCSGSTNGEAKNGPPRCEAKAKAWNCCCCPRRDNTAINREPVHWTLSIVLMTCCVIFFPSVAN